MSRTMRSWLLVLCASLWLGNQVLSAPEGRPVRIGVTVSGEYTDNRDNSADGEDTFNTMVKPRFDAIVKRERTLFDLFYAPSLLYRSNPSDVQNDTELYHDLGLNIDHRLSPRTTFSVKESFRRTDDPKVEEGGATVRRDSSYIWNRTAASLTWEMTERQNLDALAEYRVRTYDESERGEESDETAISGGATLWHLINRSLGILGEVRVGDVAYGTDAFDRDFTTFRGGIGVERVFKAGLKGGARAGMISHAYGDSSIDDEAAPYVEVSLRGAAGPSMDVGLQFVSKLDSSAVYPFASQTLMDFVGDVRWDATPSVTLSLSGTYRVGDYDEDSLPAGAVPTMGTGTEETVIVIGGVAYHIDQDTSIKLTQRYEDVESDVSVAYDRSTTTLALSRQF